MPVPAPQPHNTDTILAIAAFIAAVCVRYWRQTLALIAIAVIVLAVLGLMAGVHGIQHILSIERHAVG